MFGSSNPTRKQGKSVRPQKSSFTIAAAFLPVHNYERDPGSPRTAIKVGSNASGAGDYCIKCKKDIPFRCPHRRLANAPKPGPGGVSHNNTGSLTTSNQDIGWNVEGGKL
eukprot:TRINITY_DN16908_c0_g1_i1.p2 TRINITY_DN16908_c0_g1~~TRINITY_DN16908_c0_g1_i1.p2  ORF type:complete len:110 (+),score=28.49 TRINITY_DN16908_c0_g1_i1:229-558(+)